MFDIVKQQVNLLTVLEKDLSVTFKQMGDKNWIIDGGKDVEACPFCNHHGCFRVHFEEGDNSSAFYKCFSCGEYGDVISWKVKESKLKPVEAAKELAKEYNLKLPNDYNPIQQVFNLAAEYYHNCMIDSCNKPYPILNGLSPLRYQMEIRKRKMESLTKFRVGYSDGGLIDYLTGLNIDEAVIEKSGLVNKAGKDFLPAHCFIYPHFVKGRVSHFTFKDPTKRLQYQLPKKYSLNGYLFYGQDNIIDATSMALVEGENDLLSVYEAGGHATMAIIGQISGEQLDWLKDNWQGKGILTIFDPDDAGDKYREKVEGLRRFFKTLQHILPPDEKDIDEHLSNGADFGEILKNKVTVTLKPPEKRGLPVMPWEEAVLKGPNGLLAPQVPPAQETPLNAPLNLGEGMSLVGPADKIEPYTPPIIEGAFVPEPNPSSSEIVQMEDSSVIKMKHCYYRVTHKDGKPDYFRLSDFFLELKNIIIHEDTGIRTREIVIHRQNGFKTEVFELDSETKVSLKAFKKLMAEKADAEWMGRESDLDSMWRLVYNSYPEVTVRLVQQAGRYNKLKCWIFRNILVTDSGSEIKPDENGVFWISGKTNGIKLKGSSEGSQLEGIPELVIDKSREESDKLLGETLEGLTKILKNPGMALLILGWAYANVYSDDIYDTDGGFGILMLWGTGGKGKSTIAGWIQKFFGLTDKMASTSIQQLRTGVGFERLGSFYSSIPLFLDELRADEESDTHLSRIRSWYDRSSRVVGEKDKKNSVRYIQIRSTLLMAGEDLPADPATRERCVMLRVPPMTEEEKVSLQDNYIRMVENSDYFSSIFFNWLREYNRVDKKSVLLGIRKLDKQLVLAGCSNRISKVWSSAGYFGERLAQQFYPDFDFTSFLIDMCRSEQKQQTGDTTLSEFFSNLASIQAREHSRITDGHVYRDGDKVHIWFPAVYKEVTEDGSRGKQRSWSKNAILRSIKEESYYISDDKKVSMGISGARRIVLTLDLKKAPETLQSIVGYQKEEEEYRKIKVK